jgi:hypothetical protein
VSTGADTRGALARERRESHAQQLHALESEAVHIFREAHGEFDGR